MFVYYLPSARMREGYCTWSVCQFPLFSATSQQCTQQDILAASAGHEQF